MMDAIINASKEVSWSQWSALLSVFFLFFPVFSVRKWARVSNQLEANSVSADASQATRDMEELIKRNVKKKLAVLNESKVPFLYIGYGLSLLSIVLGF